MKIKKNIIKFIIIITPIFIINLFLKFRLKYSSKIDYSSIKLNKILINNFIGSMYSFAYINRGRMNAYINTYLKKSIIPENIQKPVLNNNDPITICVVKNDLNRLKMQLDHHRKIGIKHFVYIDNLSDDGTFEYLKEQPDVSLFLLKEKYENLIKNAWLRQATDFFGYNRWYLILDSDELFIYPGIENKNINSYIDFLESKKINTALSPMIDMFSINKNPDKELSFNEILKEYSYFDTDTYKIEKQLIRQRITGGSRIRLDNMKNTISKYSLIKLSKKMIIGTHENHPYKYNHETNGAIAFLLHFKKYMHDDTNYKGIHKLNNSLDLLNINITDKSFLNDFLKDIK